MDMKKTIQSAANFHQLPSASISFHQFPLAETIPGNPILNPHRMPSNFRMPTGTAPTILAGISDVGSQRLLAGLGMNMYEPPRGPWFPDHQQCSSMLNS